VRLQVFWEKSSELDGKTIIDATRLRNQVSERKDDLNKIRSSLTDKERAVSGQLDLIQQTRAERNTALVGVKKEISSEKDNIKGLEEASKKLTPILQSTLSRTTTPLGAASISGFVWPVRGAINSPFGPRWGGFHPGIDIQASTGDPIHATKAGPSRASGVAPATETAQSSITAEGSPASTPTSPPSRSAAAR